MSGTGVVLCCLSSIDDRALRPFVCGKVVPVLERVAASMSGYVLVAQVLNAAKLGEQRMVARAANSVVGAEAVPARSGCRCLKPNLLSR